MKDLVTLQRNDVTRRDGQNRTPLGTAAWQSSLPVVRAYTRGDFWLGRLVDGEPAGFKSDSHVQITAATRGGKGVSVVVPNILLWPGSVVVIDPKGENAMVTARRRHRGSKYSRGLGQDVCILDPFEATGTPEDSLNDLRGSYNPMDLLSADSDESIDFAARIMDAIIEDGGSDPYWPEAAKELSKFIMLHVATSPDFGNDERNLTKVRQCIVAGDVKARKLFEKLGKKKIPSGHYLLGSAMKKNNAFGGLIADAGASLMDLSINAPRVLASILQVASTNTAFLDSPGIRKCVEKSDIDLAELKTSWRGMSLYLSLPQRYMDTHYRWLRMMTTLIIGEMERAKAKPACGHQVLMVLDEFPALKRMRVLENAAAQIAGFGVKMMFIVQNLVQLKDIYKDNWETFVGNSGLKMFFAVDDHFTRQYVSSLVGECEVVRTSHSNSESEGDSWGSFSSTTKSASFGESFSMSSGTSTGGNGSSNIGNSFGVNQGSSFSQGSGTSDGGNWSRTSGSSDAIHKRPLATPDEVGRLFGSPDNPNTLTLISGCQPLVIQRSDYFKDAFFEGIFDPHIAYPNPLTREETFDRNIRAQIAESEKRTTESARRAEAVRRANIATEKRLARERELERWRRIMAEGEAWFAEQARLKQARREKWRKRRDAFCIFFLPFAFAFTCASVIFLLFG